MGTVECIAFITRETLTKIQSSIDTQTLTSRICNVLNVNVLNNEKHLFSCPTFCILKADFDRFLKISNQCKKYNTTFPNTIQSLLGLPRDWGQYKHMITFSIKKSNLYKPLATMNGIKAVRYKADKLPSNISLNSLEANPFNKVVFNIEKQLDAPFIGTGRTLITDKKAVSEKLKNALKALYNAKFDGQGFKEYVIPGGVQMTNVTLYSSYFQYCRR